jgi:O-antigen biosynthesis protein
LIQAFKLLVDKGNKHIKLIIAGGMLDIDKKYVDELKKSVQGYPIQIIENIDRDSLLALYSKASIYWHAAGYGIDSKRYPEQVEHFGISIVEAMASGAIPFVYNVGGPVEIVSKAGVCWNSIDDLITTTEEVLNDTALYEQYKTSAIERSTYFNREQFQKSFEQFI